MHAAIVNERPMSTPDKPRMGRPKKNPDMATIRIEAEVNELAKQASGIFAESVVAYVTRIVREKAEQDILENAREVLKRAEEREAKRKKKLAE